MVFVPISYNLLLGSLCPWSRRRSLLSGGRGLHSICCLCSSVPFWCSLKWRSVATSAINILLCPEWTQCHITVLNAWSPYVCMKSATPVWQVPKAWLRATNPYQTKLPHTQWVDAPRLLPMSVFSFKILWLRPTLFCEYSSRIDCIVCDTIARCLCSHCPWVPVTVLQGPAGSGRTMVMEATKVLAFLQPPVSPLTIPGYFTSSQ